MHNENTTMARARLSDNEWMKIAHKFPINTYPKMMLQRNESVVITVNICIRIWFNKCAVDGVLTEPILA